jgi:hypothetical protein
MAKKANKDSKPETTEISGDTPKDASEETPFSPAKFSWNYWLIVATVTGTLAFYFIYRSGQAKAVASKPVSLLDSMIGFTPEQAYDVLRALGPEGRKIYREINLVDFLIAPLVFREILINTFPATSGWNDSLREIFANTYMLADVLENVCIASMLKLYPQERPVMAWIGSGGNVVKNVAVILAALTALYEMFVWIKGKLVKPKTKKTE